MMRLLQRLVQWTADKMVKLEVRLRLYNTSDTSQHIMNLREDFNKSIAELHERVRLRFEEAREMRTRLDYLESRDRISTKLEDSMCERILLLEEGMAAVLASREVTPKQPSVVWPRREIDGCPGAMHHQPVEVFADESEGTMYHASSLSQVRSGDPGMVLLNCTGNSCGSWLGPEVLLNWPDFGVPTVKVGGGGNVAMGAPEWLQVISEIEPYDNVMVACMGGHGRTGTALAILLGACSKMPATSLVEAIRSRYCLHAVENQEQEKYVVTTVRAIRALRTTERRNSEEETTGLSSQAGA